MSATTDATLSILEKTRNAAHPFCIVCGKANECGLGLCFSRCEDGSVEAVFDCHEKFQGYRDILHGGITSALLDGAMTNCLFAHGIVAVTAEMNIRFRHPIKLGMPIVLRAKITREQSPLYVVDASLIQENQLRAKSTGKFMEQPI